MYIATVMTATTTFYVYDWGTEYEEGDYDKKYVGVDIGKRVARVAIGVGKMVGRLVRVNAGAVTASRGAERADLIELPLCVPEAFVDIRL